MSEQEVRRGGYSLFCDDIRQEANNKTSFMGCYDGELNIHVPYPATFSKFCVSAVYYQPASDEARDVTIKLMLQDEETETVLADGQLPAEAFRRTFPPDPLFTHPRVAANAHIVISPFVVQKDCVLKVRAYYGDEEIKLGAIVVRSKFTEAMPAVSD